MGTNKDAQCMYCVKDGGWWSWAMTRWKDKSLKNRDRRKNGNRVWWPEWVCSSRLAYLHAYSPVEMFGRIKRWVLVGGGILLGMGSFEVSKAFTSLSVCLALCLLPLDKDVALSYYCSTTACLCATMIPIMKTKLLTLWDYKKVTIKMLSLIRITFVMVSLQRNSSEYSIRPDYGARS